MESYLSDPTHGSMREKNMNQTYLHLINSNFKLSHEDGLYLFPSLNISNEKSNSHIRFADHSYAGKQDFNDRYDYDVYEYGGGGVKRTSPEMYSSASHNNGSGRSFNTYDKRQRYNNAPSTSTTDRNGFRTQNASRSIQLFRDIPTYSRDQMSGPHYRIGKNSR